eukprot:2286582-Rhodomonas_salina.1
MRRRSGELRQHARGLSREHRPLPPAGLQPPCCPPPPPLFLAFFPVSARFASCLFNSLLACCSLPDLRMLVLLLSGLWVMHDLPASLRARSDGGGRAQRERDLLAEVRGQEERERRVEEGARSLLRGELSER